MSAGKALIVQNKGGGHGELGYHLANILTAQGISVTLLQDNSANRSKQPFSSYSQLEEKGVNVIWGEFSKEISKNLPENEKFDFVFDNFAKNKETASDIAQKAKSWGVKNYVYVSSAGMYKNSEEVPLLETDPVKETGQREVELLAEEMDLPWTAFRPQYIYGPLMNKRDYLDWFFDRITWALDTIPMPHHGDQFVTITRAEDVASMMASVIDNPKATKQVFNCASTRSITYNDLLRRVAEACGSDYSKIKINPYDPKKFGVENGFFPFRENHFFVSCDKAVNLLNWSPEFDLVEDLEWYKYSYIAAGKADSPPNFETDDAINSKIEGYLSWGERFGDKERHPDLHENLESIRKTMIPMTKEYYIGMLDKHKYDSAIEHHSQEH
eukprot:CAMPEP_0171455490 /NCGR_PEP_ID=MMETSP0945-20130129/2363_1 /TAXON_ID=109269 /ORGANISM="Vaucheria litorea, Strain CCMP2940" /LENGTH=383 /DNA_ID=CAMNT_0011980739 /DNA_START=107 /DNA_END=1258 /DNA_ORIENTATION=+